MILDELLLYLCLENGLMLVGPKGVAVLTLPPKTSPV